MKKLLMLIPLVFLSCFSVGCQQGEEVASEDAGMDIQAIEDMAADPWNGTWKLNAAKSKAPGGQIPHPSSTNIIEIQGETVHLIADHTDASGKLEHVEYTAKLDGNEYPVTSTPPGPQPYTISLKQINPRTREFAEVIGSFTIKGRDVLSEDGKSFSRIVDSKDAEGYDTSVIQVFEKQ
ncbi:MAG: hypothetical protein JXR49_02970 [Acidobacteria bacterium]|nr:hypothetical protein [Acidobacteriota bacterium]